MNTLLKVPALVPGTHVSLVDDDGDPTTDPRPYARLERRVDRSGVLRVTVYTVLRHSRDY